MLKPANKRFAVLDIESVPCPDASALAPRSSQNLVHRGALQKIACASLLYGTEEGATLHVEDLRTFSLATHEESHIIGMLDLLLPSCNEHSLLITYNGVSHDLRLLMLRACSLWMFPLDTLAAWSTAPASLHLDLHRSVYGGQGISRWSLADISAAHGLALRPGLLAKSIFWLHEHERYEVIEEHNRMDVAATFLSYAAHRSFVTGRNRYLLSAWAELGRVFEHAPSCVAKVNPLASHCLVSAARQALETSPAEPPDEPY